MKLRIKSNTVRFRTTRSEVATLISRGRLEEKIEFAQGGGEFTYAIVLKVMQMSSASNMLPRPSPLSSQQQRRDLGLNLMPLAYTQQARDELVL